LTGTLGTLVYNVKNQTTSITPPGGTAFSMTYAGDGQGQRVTAGAAAYQNDTLGIGSETVVGATTYYTRTPGGRLVSERSGASTYYYLVDGLGSVVALIDTGATVQDTYSYDPYGKVTAGTGNSVANPWQYTGGYYDSSTKLVKLGQRFYDPSLGRWTQRDPLPKGNRYVYAGDNPTNFVDPTGLIGTDSVIHIAEGVGVVSAAAFGLGCGLCGVVTLGAGAVITANAIDEAVNPGPQQTPQDLVNQYLNDPSNAGLFGAAGGG